MPAHINNTIAVMRYHAAQPKLSLMTGCVLGRDRKMNLPVETRAFGAEGFGERAEGVRIITYLRLRLLVVSGFLDIYPSERPGYLPTASFGMFHPAEISSNHTVNTDSTHRIDAPVRLTVLGRVKARNPEFHAEFFRGLTRLAGRDLD